MTPIFLNVKFSLNFVEGSKTQNPKTKEASNGYNEKGCSEKEGDNSSEEDHRKEDRSQEIRLLPLRERIRTEREMTAMSSPFGLSAVLAS
ncbi:MAG: hypothetical protein HYS21_13930 [Deltaproteobacteria bacterium]|nr:hypothetical protein [Deltaproteobacteria bacterium]